MMRGVVAPANLRRDLAGVPQPTGGPDRARKGSPSPDSVVSIRQIEPRIPSDTFPTLGSPIHTYMIFEIEKRKPFQLTLIEAHSMLWDSYLRAGYAWRFRLPKGTDKGFFLLRLTLKQR